MPRYLPFSLKNTRFGLNTRQRENKLAPGEAVVCDNIDLSKRTIRKRDGLRPLLTGTEDAIQKGGPPGVSLSVRGEPYWLEHPELQRQRPAGTDPLHREGWFRREGLMVIPEAGHAELRHDVQSGDPHWCLEFQLWSDDATLRHTQNSVTTPPPPAVIMCKSTGTESQWDVRLVSEAAPGSGRVRMGVQLTLYRGASHAAGTSFFYQTAGTNEAFFEPGKNHWLAFAFDSVAATITSYYWQEGMASVVSSVQGVTGLLRLNGVGQLQAPVVIGRRPSLINDGGSPYRFLETGFNGVISALRYYSDLSGSAFNLPTFDTSWALARELTSSELGMLDMTLAFEFTEQYIADTRFVEPAFDLLDPGVGDPPVYVRQSNAWMTGADATWVDGTEVGINNLQIAGTKMLAFVPAPNAAANSNRREDYYLASANATEAHVAGLRISRGDRYLTSTENSTSSNKELAFPTDFTIRSVVQFDAIINAGGIRPSQIIFQLSRVRQGTTNTWDYVVEPFIRLSINYGDPDGGGTRWYIFGRVRDGTGAANDVYSPNTFTIPEGEPINITLAYTIKDEISLHLYVTTDTSTGLIERIASTTTGTGPAALPASENSGTTPKGTANRSNFDGDDGREFCYPIAIGCSIENDGNTATPGETFHFGCPTATNINLATGHRYWAFHTDEHKKTPDSGILHRGKNSIRGSIGSLQIWSRFLTEGEVKAHATSAPDAQQIAGYGNELLSSWDFEEGKGRIAFDAGYLGNHIPLNPYPMVRKQAGPTERVDRPKILGFWEKRGRTPREGVDERHLYALAGGSMLEMQDAAGGGKFLQTISSRLLTQTQPLPTAFQFSDFFYLCTGEGPVLRLSRGKLVGAGVSPVFGQPQADNLGWVEEDRDGTFQIIQPATSSGDFGTDDTQPFEIGKTYRWRVTYYDPESGVESAPSREIVHTVEAWGPSGSASGASYSGNPTHINYVELSFLPRSQQKHITKMRIYRTRANDGVFRFVDEITARQQYFDSTTDDKLGVPLTSSRNFPPPFNARIGIIWGSRAVYAGVPEDPSSVYYSFQGFPEAVPAEYKLTITGSARSDEITGLHPMQNRTLVFMQDSTFVLFDSGADIAFGSSLAPPVQISVLKENVGCVNHHTIVSIDGLGAVFAGERGIYVTDGNSFTYVSEQIEPTYDALDRTSYRSWHAVHWRKKDQYWLFCSSGAVPGKNDLVIVWDYRRGEFARYVLPTTIRYSQVIEDEATGQNRLYCADDYGGLHEAEVSGQGADGVPSGSATSGTTPALGPSDTTIQLVNDNSLPTDGQGLRGVELTLTISGSDETRTIISNTDEEVTVETAFSTTPPTNTPWKLGLYGATWKSGLYDLGSQTRLKKVNFTQLDLEPTSGSDLALRVSYDGSEDNDFTVDPTRTEERFAPVLGRGAELQITVSDDEPDNPWEVTQIDVGWHSRGRSTY